MTIEEFSKRGRFAATTLCLAMSLCILTSCGRSRTTDPDEDVDKAIELWESVSTADLPQGCDGYPIQIIWDCTNVAMDLPGPYVTVNSESELPVSHTYSTPGLKRIRCRRGAEGEWGENYRLVYVKAHISAYATSDGCFAGYAQRCTGNRRFPFSSGKDFLDGLAEMTEKYGFIADINVFSHAWSYQSSSGIMHGGGFWGSGGDCGFYGVTNSTDHSDARTLADLSAAISSGRIKLWDEGRVFVEGCHIGEIGSFASGLSSITGRGLICACGNVDEQTDSDGKMFFRSAPGTFDESTNPDYDGWLESGSQTGSSFYAW